MAARLVPNDAPDCYPTRRFALHQASAGANLRERPGRVTSRIASGVLVIDKPRGPTSHDVVARVRRALGVQGVGHAGTLDPMATGVLVLAVGEATKLVPWLTAQDKAYEATIAVGVETDTLDADGREMRRVPPGTQLLEALSAFRTGQMMAPMLEVAVAAELARTSQIPPAFSALKHDGKRAYAVARQGEQPLLLPRPVQVKGLKIVACTAEPATISVALCVGKGYYVRALARDLAIGLGTVGHIASLRRTRSGSFFCGEALSLEIPSDELLARMQPLTTVARRALPIAELSYEGALDARLGRRVRARDIHALGQGSNAWLDPSGELVAIGEIDESGCGKVVRGFNGPG